jgi:hypothetical protein
MPKPYAVVSIEANGIKFIAMENLSVIDPATRMILVVGDEDIHACKATSLAIWERTTQIPEANRTFLLVRSDRRGAPAQIAQHFFPGTSGYGDTAAVDARDFFVTYKLSVGALHCVFDGRDCEYAFGATQDKQVFMGKWSNGTPVRPMLRIRRPDRLATTCQDR